jgi:hypothetical protein
VCDHENLVEQEAMALAGLQGQRKNVYYMKGKAHTATIQTLKLIYRVFCYFNKSTSNA